jgi:hypothetical protein
MIMRRSGAVFADIAVICSKKQRAENALPQNPCHLGRGSCEITAKTFADIPLLFSVTDLNKRIKYS